MRMALGASRTSAVWLIVRDAAIMVVAGMLVAAPATLALRRLVAAQLFGVTALHAPTIAGAALILVAVSLSAAMLPAWRAASVNPIDALRL